MEKVCSICEKIFQPKVYPSGKTETLGRFNSRKCCSKQCGLILGNQISSQNRIKNPDEVKLGRQQRAKKYYERDKKIKLEQQALKWKTDESFRKKRTQYVIERKKKDVLFHLTIILRGRIQKSIVKKYKNTTTIELLGDSIDNVRNYIESLWLPGMSWENNTLDGWHIDHIIPLSSCKSEEDMKKLCHYTNLQPLWSKDNLQKGDKVFF